MKRTITAVLLLLGAIATAQAGTAEQYRDMIRPHGHKRPNAVLQAASRACYAKTGASRYRLDTPAFKQCMLGHGYRWLYTYTVRARSNGVSIPDSPTYPDNTPPAAPTPAPVQPPPDPTTGMPIPGHSY